LPAILERIEVQFKADQEHVHDYAELGDHAQERGNRCRQQKFRCPGKHSSQDRWPEHDPGNHFADDGRLAQVAEHNAQEPAEPHDRDQRHEDVDDGTLLAASGCLLRTNRSHRFWCAETLPAGVDHEKEGHRAQEHRKINNERTHERRLFFCRLRLSVRATHSPR
jgi:hypothetical protein